VVSKENTMRISPGLAAVVAFLTGWMGTSFAQSSGVPDPTSSRASSGSVQTILTLVIFAVIAVAAIAVARYVTGRRKRMEDAVILQSQLFDALSREAQLRGLHITPRARVSGWRRSRVTIEVVGEVPTPELRGTVMQIASAETKRLQPDAIPEDHLFIVPPTRGV
jgi:hypothetical protein